MRRHHHRPRRLPRAWRLSPATLPCQNCGAELHCSMCNAPHPLGYWTQEQVDRFNEVLEKMDNGELGEFDELFKY